MDNDLTGNEVYMILYQRAAIRINQRYDDMKSARGKPSKAGPEQLSGDEWMEKYGG